MCDALGHPWMQGEMATKEEIVKEFEERKQVKTEEELKVKK